MVVHPPDQAGTETDMMLPAVEASQGIPIAEGKPAESFLEENAAPAELSKAVK